MSETKLFNLCKEWHLSRIAAVSILSQGDTVTGEIDRLANAEDSLNKFIVQALRDAVEQGERK